MEAVVFTGLPGSGKSSFFQHRFFHTHVRISLDLLKTRYRERRLLAMCLETDLRFVVDNTNPAAEDRAFYLKAARAARARYAVTGYYFQSTVEDCLRRNAARSGTGRVPDVAILSAASRLEVPTLEEGFDALYTVRLTEHGFAVDRRDPPA